MENLTLDGGTRAVVSRMEHIHLGVADATRSIDFYRRAFGFEVRYEEGAPGERCVHVGTDRFYVAMSEDPALTPAQDGGGSAKIYHLGLVTADLDALRERLRREGLCADDIAEVYERPEGRSIYVYDPDGHEVEVVEYRAGYIYR